MKVKRHKHVKKILMFYKTNFNIQPPYTVLADGTFCKAALKFKVNINEQLPKYLDGEVKVITTKCVTAECEALGSLLYGPLKVLRQFTGLWCGHDPSQPAVTCMKKQAKKKHLKYIIATQDPDLSEKVRNIPGVPLLFISHKAINLEDPSEASKKTADGAILDKMAVPQNEHERLKELKKAVFGETEFKKRKRKGPKGPNPLSCKKKKTNEKKNRNTDSLKKAKTKHKKNKK